MRVAWIWLLPVAIATTSCAKLINADFDGLSLGGRSMGSAGAGGASISDMPDSGTSVEMGGDGGGAGDDQGGAGGDAGESADGSAAEASTGGAGGAGGSKPAIDAAAERETEALEDASNDASEVGPPDTSSADDGGDADEPAPSGRVVINEVQGSGTDFIELYNPTAYPVVLDGIAVAQAMGSDGGPDLGVVLKFPAGTTLGGGSYLLVLANQASTGGPNVNCVGLAPTCYYVEWGISKDGEGVYLLAPNYLLAPKILDQVYYPGTTASRSYGREPNGTGDFVVTAVTPDGPNAL